MFYLRSAARSCAGWSGRPTSATVRNPRVAEVTSRFEAEARFRHREVRRDAARGARATPVPMPPKRLSPALAVATVVVRWPGARLADLVHRAFRPSFPRSVRSSL